MNFWQYIATNYTEILALLLEHIKLTAISVGLAVLIGVPLGIFISYMSKASKIVLSIANVIQAIPSMALLAYDSLLGNRCNSRRYGSSTVFIASHYKKHVYGIGKY